jgi:DNA-binding response OmpR family regulator
MKKILIVEDDKDIRDSLVDLLELSNFEDFSAKNGEEGYEEIVGNKPDLVLSDINMPKLDGFELLKKVNDNLKIKPLFIYLTAKVESQDINKGLKLGAVEYILKPFDYMNVVDRINHHTSKK